MFISKKKQNNIQCITVEIKDHLSSVIELFQSIRKPMMDTTLNGMKLMVDHDDCTEDELPNPIGALATESTCVGVYPTDSGF